MKTLGNIEPYPKDGEFYFVYKSLDSEEKCLVIIDKDFLPLAKNLRGGFSRLESLLNPEKVTPKDAFNFAEKQIKLLQLEIEMSTEENKSNLKNELMLREDFLKNHFPDFIIEKSTENHKKRIPIIKFERGIMVIVGDWDFRLIEDKNKFVKRLELAKMRISKKPPAEIEIRSNLFSSCGEIILVKFLNYLKESSYFEWNYEKDNSDALNFAKSICEEVGLENFIILSEHPKYKV